MGPHLKFPFDRLQCGVDFGGWAISDAQQGLRLLGTGFDFNSQEATSGASYQEFAISRIETSVARYAYAQWPKEPWTVVHYQLTLARASAFYVHILVWPGIIITLSSFAVFFITPESGERLGFGVTTILWLEVIDRLTHDACTLLP